MALVKHESRSRVGVDWYDNEAEADAAADALEDVYGAQAIADASIGFVQVGRDPVFDLKDESGDKVAFAVVTP